MFRSQEVIYFNLLNMGVAGIFYRTFGRRFSTILLASVTGAFVFEVFIDGTVEKTWDRVNHYYYVQNILTFFYGTLG